MKYILQLLFLLNLFVGDELSTPHPVNIATISMYSSFYNL
jgi:hypothetical protein